jgi:Ca2+-binding RTX toxin-like protein
VVVVGSPPPGAQLTLRNDATVEEARTKTFDLDDVAGDTDWITEVGTVFRQLWYELAEDGGASRVAMTCQMEGGPNTEPFSTCAGHATAHLQAPAAHVDAYFQGNANATARTTVTLTFGTCDGRAVTGTTPTNGHDVLLGTPGNDTINGLGGNDRLCGGGGNDTLRGGNGRDRVIGGNGADRVEGGNDNDALYGSAGNDLLLGQAGIDGHDGGANRDNCNGGLDRDTAVRCEVKAAIP